MIAHKCQVIHRPQYGFYGDCLRACVASILEMEPDAVPHVFQDGCDGVEGDKRLTGFLRGVGLGTFRAYFPGDVSLDDLLTHVASGSSENVCQILICSIDGGNHAVVIQNGKIVHDPALYVVRNYAPAVSGYWEVMALVKL